MCKSIFWKKIVKKSALIAIATKFGIQEVDSFFQHMTMKTFDTQIFEIIFSEKMVGDAGRLFMVALVVKTYLNWQQISSERVSLS